MKVVHLCASDREGGAAKAAQRIHAEVLKQGHDSDLIVMRGDGRAKNVHLANRNLIGRLGSRVPTILDSAVVKLFFNKLPGRAWSPGLVGCTNLSSDRRVREADVIVLYWVDGGFLSTAQVQFLLALGKRVVWRLSDMWPFTGGCHYSEGCYKFRDECGACPQLQSTLPFDPSFFTLKKKTSWNTENLKVVCPSSWIRDLSETSRVFNGVKHHLVATGVDTTIFRPNFGHSTHRSETERTSDDKKLKILFGAVNSLTDWRKGGQELRAAIKIFSDNCSSLQKYELNVFGANDEALTSWSGIDVKYLGSPSLEAELSAIYRSADIFVAPSKEENLANTVIEALACGTPVVAFAVGGMVDLIDHMKNGYLAKPFDINDLANGIQTVCEKIEESDDLAVAARTKALVSFDQEKQIKKFIDVLEGNENAA